MKKYAIDGSFTGVVFNKISKKLIYQFKYQPYLSGLSGFIADLLYESLIQNEEFNRILSSQLFFIPIPLSSARFKKRGYNQAEILAKSLGKKFGFPVYNCLTRVKETRSQVGLSKKERKENVKGAFDINSKFKNQKSKFVNRNILLVDDVLTTGSTFSEAGLLLKRAGAAKVWAVAFAREQ